MSNVMDVVTITVNWIRANAINHRKFEKFLADTTAEYGDLVMFTAVRRLHVSKDSMTFQRLKRLL